jgi:hypothetical protein
VMKPIQYHRANLAKHGVLREEVLECFLNQQRQYLRKARRGIYQLIAQTAAGRYLEILYENRSNEVYVFHAMDARPFQIRLLKRRGKRR